VTGDQGWIDDQSVLSSRFKRNAEDG